MAGAGTLVVGIVGIDGSGKSTTFRSVLDEVARSATVFGIGDVVLAGGPGRPTIDRYGLPWQRVTRLASTR